MEFMDMRDQIIQAAHLLFDAGVMSHSGHANMSARLPDGEHMLLTARGSIRSLAPDQLAVTDFAGNTSDGSLEPTTKEIVSMHAGVYRERADVRAIIHTHSPHVTSFALAHKPLPCRYEALLRFGVTEDIPVAAWGPRGSEESVRAIIETLRAHPGIPAVLLANHGLLAFGADIMATAQLIVAMEEGAETTLDAAILGGAQPFPPGALEQVRAHMRRFA
jgi:L-fuculose-phosphate aldolase